jgi:hypothetical protein
MRRAIVVMLLFVAGAAAPARGAELSTAQRQQILVEAQQAYDRGIALLPSDPAEARRRFTVAAERFKVLVDDGVDNGRLHYNLANAYLQAAEIGPAVLHYRRAERYEPGDPRLRSNLAYARTLCRSRIEPGGGRALADALLGWHRGTPIRTRITIFAVAWCALWIGLVALRFRSSPALRAGLAVLAVIVVVTGASVAADLWLAPAQPEGVILADDVIVRKGNGEGFEPSFQEPLHQGVEFTLLARRAGWLHIELPDGKQGWIRAERAEMV